MLTVIALFHLSFPAFLPVDPPMHPRVLPPQRIERCRSGICSGRPIR
jgi:hypothetical protein